MNTMEFWLSINSFMMVLRRSSNWPRYFVPATMSERSRRKGCRLSARKGGTSPSDMRCARPFDDGGLAHTRLADQNRIVLGATAQNLDDALNFAFAANEWIEETFRRPLA